jgi:hypothetical protein
MALKLETLSASNTLAQHQAILSGIEALGYELITFARGVVGGAKSNTATFRNRAPGDGPGPLTLVQVDGAKSPPDQEADVNAGETGGKRLISYAAAFVQEVETNVAAYRG